MRGRDHSQVEHYAALTARPGPPWLTERRSAALQALKTHGFPGRRDDAWWNTPTKPMLARPFQRVESAQVWQAELPDGPRVVLVDGRFDPEHSRLVAGLRPLSAALDAAHDVLLDDTRGFDALNAALADDGAVIEVDGPLDEPLHLVHVSTGADRLGLVRHVVRVGPGAEVTVVEHWLGSGQGSSLSSAVTEIELAAGATCRWIKRQVERDEAHHVATVVARVAADATLQAWSFATGAAVSRTELRIELAGEGARCDLSGLALLRGRQHTDHHLLVDHVAPGCGSTQTFRSILADRAHSVFTGKVVVREGATKTDSGQTHHSLLLSDDAIASARPQLEIYNDDVVCAHGATVGRLDDESMFYLRARGLSPIEARSLLINAFATQVVDSVPEAVRGLVAQQVQQWLEASR